MDTSENGEEEETKRGMLIVGGELGECPVYIRFGEFGGLEKKKRRRYLNIHVSPGDKVFV